MPALRPDRLLTLRLFHPLQRAGWDHGKFRIPILMYHSIADDRQCGIPAYYKTATSPAAFERQLRFLREEGFRSVGLDEAVRLVREKRAQPEKAAVITFDDGFRDFCDLAFPVLKRYGFTATMFLPTAFISENRRSFNGRECLTWREVGALRSHGIRFGSHTVNHPLLYELSWNEIESELILSKAQMEHELEEEVTSFAYPYAFPQQDRRFTERFTELLRELGYQNCVTTAIGRVKAGDDPFCLKRLPVNDGDDQALLAAKLDGAYDWLAHPQNWYKTARYRLGRVSRNKSGLRSMMPSFEPANFPPNSSL